jgi:hypothetical protein
MSKRTIYQCDWCGVEAEREKPPSMDPHHRHMKRRLPKDWRHRAVAEGLRATIIEIICGTCGKALDEAIEAVKQRRSQPILGKASRPDKEAKTP